MSERFSPTWLVARQELLLAARSRWTQIFAAVFALLALAVSTSGYILSGGRGFQDFARTSASLVQLVVLVVPLASLLMGVLALSPERGTAELLFSQPVSRRAILLGKLLGLLAALAAAEFVGFGLAGLIVFSSTGEEGGWGYALLVLGSFLLTAAFLAIAALIAAGAVGRKRTRALALAVVVWFVAVILLDLAALGVASLLPSTAASRLLIVSVMANPAGAVRTGALLGIEGTAAFGSASLALLRFTGGPAGAAVLLALSTLAWVIVPTAAAARRLSRVDL
ncbi:MAG TPA: ABC transporter permease subunit [Anaeromyxobacteraceae bacterium]|nr:ABC transporter permease subunit [Anaeromyxobacteraceae bacterium]